MAKPVEQRSNKSLQAPGENLATGATSDTPGATTPGIEDTSYERLEALRATRGEGGGESGGDSSYDHIEDLRAARAAGSEDTSYDRIEELRAGRGEHVEDTSTLDDGASGTMHHQ